MTEKLDKNPFHLSRGERQRVALASVLGAANARAGARLADDGGRTTANVSKLWKIVRQQNESGTTVIIKVSHDMELVSDYAKRVVLSFAKAASTGGRALWREVV